MSCWHFTAVLRIPALALGFKYLREWNEFLEKHEDDFRREEDCFCESLSEDFPLLFSWGETINRYTDRKLDQRDPEQKARCVENEIDEKPAEKQRHTDNAGVKLIEKITKRTEKHLWDKSHAVIHGHYGGDRLNVADDTVQHKEAHHFQHEMYGKV